MNIGEETMGLDKGRMEIGKEDENLQAIILLLLYQLDL
jgi:hypothetical protein